ncbi:MULTISPECIES: SH3 domain-containing protein [unclassified Facklamia]|uniref:SH3 domain-containing protein n=1 Tax=Aerococcaceae TaxID=186827 RepID=UPI0013D26147|nr:MULTISPECIES: SH3 domain-containing protein [unclassified Facklamia]
MIRQSGQFFPNQTVAIKNKPSLGASSVGFYKPGESFVYDGYIHAEGMVWLSYVGGSGIRRYVAWRKINGKKCVVIKQLITPSYPEQGGFNLELTKDSSLKQFMED